MKMKIKGIRLATSHFFQTAILTAGSDSSFCGRQVGEHGWADEVTKDDKL